MRRSPAAILAPLLLLAGCATSPTPADGPRVSLPLHTAWFDGAAVFYITTDVSDPQVARDKDANHAPRLALALPLANANAGATRPRNPTDKVYASTNFTQAPVFASAPQPLGAGSRSSAYSPLWQMVTVTWQPGRSARTLRSEEDILAAQEKGDVVLADTAVVLNCAVVHDGRSGLPGARLSGVPGH